MKLINQILATFLLGLFIGHFIPELAVILATFGGIFFVITLIGSNLDA